MPSELNLSQLKIKGIAVNYQWQDTTHILAGGVDREKNLYLLEYFTCPPFTLSSSIADRLKAAQYRKYTVFSNKFEPLQVEVGFRCKQFDQATISNMVDFYNNLEADERFYIVEGVKIPSKNDNFTDCLYLLLRGFLRQLCHSPGNSIFFSSVSKFRDTDPMYPPYY